MIAIPIHAPPLPPLVLPPQAVDVVKKIALICLKELAASLAFGGIIACFVAPGGGIAVLVSAALIQMSVSLFFHSLGAFAAHKAAQGKNRDHFERIVSICEYITGTNFALFTGLNSHTLIHETGHALAALAVYKKPRPAIEVIPFMGGFTKYYKKGLNPFGKTIGPVAATCFIVASGPSLTLLISSALLIIGLAIKEKYPHFSKYLICWGMVDFLVHAHYAYSALHADPSNLAHDFVHLSIFGVHPVTAAVGILAIPILILAGSYWVKQGPQEGP